MLKNTFQHIPRFGNKSEQQIWDSGIHHWDDVKEPYPKRFSKQKINKLSQSIQDSKEKYRNQDPKYFTDLLASGLHWRLFPDFRESTVYLDIETTGLTVEDADITTIAMYDGKVIKYYVNGQNLDEFVNDIQKYKVIVTYNGKCFDVPFIESYFRTEINHAHILQILLP